MTTTTTTTTTTRRTRPPILDLVLRTGQAAGTHAKVFDPGLGLGRVCNVLVQHWDRVVELVQVLVTALSIGIVMAARLPDPRVCSFACVRNQTPVCMLEITQGLLPV